MSRCAAVRLVATMVAARSLAGTASALTRTCTTGSSCTPSMPIRSRRSSLSGCSVTTAFAVATRLRASTISLARRHDERLHPYSRSTGADQRKPAGIFRQCAFHHGVGRCGVRTLCAPPWLS
ncbi:hypothetical protein CA833_14810 [Novosphingobium sp. KA1]|nr:hypothetical protein CA833_14810 [Novosphingobium sp. KA1]